MSKAIVYFNTFAGRDAAAAALAGAIHQRLAPGLDHRPTTLVVPGGSTPVGLFTHLRTRPLDWARVTVVPTDERWVAADDAASNEGLLRRELLCERAAEAALFGFYRADSTPRQAAGRLADALTRIERPFDHVVLGMGGDGHTASLFPDAANIDAMLASRDDIVVPERDDAGPARVSLSAAALTAARAISLVFFGADKREVFARARCVDDPTTLPIAAVLRGACVPVRVYWAP